MRTVAPGKKWHIRALFGPASIVLLLLGTILFPGNALAETVNDPEAVFDTTTSVSSTNSQSVSPGYNDQKSVNFSGQLQATGGFLLNRDWMSGKGNAANNQTLQVTEGDFLLDLRYPNGLKAFIDASVLHSSAPISTANASDTSLGIKEFFVEYHVNHQIYVRTGKQFAVWGRSYFWNPVDFVNRNRQDFYNLTALQSGVVGTRLDFPMGTDSNLYFFLDQDGVTNPKDLAGVAKADLTWGNLAVGFSIWSRYRAVTQYGFDWSTNIWNWNVSSEFAISHGSNQLRMIDSPDGPVVGRAPSAWQARSTLTLMRQWNWERPNRITGTLEMFYNGDGYSTNVLDNPETATYLQTHNLIASNQLSSFYSAAFVTVSEFPTHDQSCAINGLLNAIDGSNVLSAQMTHNFSTDFNISALIANLSGGQNTEYGRSGAGVRVQAQTTLKF